MTRKDLEKMLLYIVNQSIKLKNKYIDDFEIKVEFGDIFSQSKNEYDQLIKVISALTKPVYKTPTGNIYSLTQPINTPVGKLYYVKIRKPDPSLKYRGDADFDTEYMKLKSFVFNPGNASQQSRDSKRDFDKQFELIVRDKFEMIRLSDPDFDVMTCFSNIPVRKWIK